MQTPNLSIRIRSIIFWGIMYVYSIIVFLIAVFVLPLPAKPRHKFIISWNWVFDFCARNICKLQYNVIGMENMIDGPAIISSNHQSVWETISFSMIFPQHVWILKKSLLKIPFFGWALKISDPIGIDRSKGNNAMKEVLSQGLDRFKKGFWIMTFPEGTRLNPGERKKYKSGTARLAILLDCPILPVAHNAGCFFPHNGLWLYPGTVTVKICPAIYRSSDDPILLTKQLEDCINIELDKMGS